MTAHSSGCLCSHDLPVGVGILPGVQEVHGNVHHHSQPEGHLSTLGRHSAQVPSQVQL